MARGPEPTRSSRAARSGAPAIERRANPRRVRNGIKLDTRDGSLPLTPFTRAWGCITSANIPLDRQEDGWAYAVSGQVVSIDITADGLRAYVQGTTRTPYETRIRLERLPPGHWDRIIEAMAAEARYAARLLDGALPDTAEEMFADHGVAMLPTSRDPIEITCTCNDDRPCKHAAAVAFVLTERMAARPIDLLTLRGMPAEHLLERIQQARAMQAHGETSAHIDPAIGHDTAPPPSLDACIDEFWRSPVESHDADEDAPLPDHVPHALLRRLGPSPMKGAFPMVGLLASIYDAVGQEASRVRDEGSVEGSDEATERGSAHDDSDGER